jgi:hypothetical protein
MYLCLVKTLAIRKDEDWRPMQRKVLRLGWSGCVSACLVRESSVMSICRDGLSSPFGNSGFVLVRHWIVQVTVHLEKQEDV